MINIFNKIGKSSKSFDEDQINRLIQKNQAGEMVCSLPSRGSDSDDGVILIAVPFARYGRHIFVIKGYPPLG